MSVLAADNNGGRVNNVHNQTDDGLVISVNFGGNNLVPLVFRYTNYFGCMEESILSSAFYPHKKLMRGDCGWQEKDDSVDITFSWNRSYDVIDGLSAGPSGEYVSNYHTEYENVSDTLLEGLRGHRKVFYRKDRNYWTPDKTLEATSEESPFGFTQWNPMSCKVNTTDKCGIVNFYPKCHKKKGEEQ